LMPGLSVRICATSWRIMLSAHIMHTSRNNLRHKLRSDLYDVR
jgi:hypothetical protein